MTKKKIILIVSASVFVFFYSFGLLTLGIYYGSTINEKSYETQIANRYVVREYNNIIAVFEYGSDIPQKVLDINITTLRSQDRLRFQEGIVVNSIEELAQLEEDFCS